MEDTFPDLGSLGDKELKDPIDNLTAEKDKISYRRRVLHGKIDVEQPTQILAGRAQGEDPAA